MHCFVHVALQAEEEQEKVEALLAASGYDADAEREGGECCWDASESCAAVSAAMMHQAICCSGVPLCSSVCCYAEVIAAIMHQAMMMTPRERAVSAAVMHQAMILL